MFKKVNARAKNLSLADIKLLNLAVFFAAVIAVRFLPVLSRLNVWWLAALALACLVKPFYSFWLKKEQE